jgi:hypothetical protein
MSSDLRQIWYSLVQSDGTAFKGSTAATVELLPGALIDHLRRAVKAENAANKLAKVDASDLRVFKVYKGENHLENELLDEELPVSVLGEAGKKKKDAVLVLVPESRVSSRSSSSLTTAQPQSDLKPYRQTRYKKMSVEASCRKYLCAIATKLLKNYDFDCQYKKSATIGDVLAAKDGVEGEDWDYRKARKTHNQIDGDGFTTEIRKGQPLTKVKLCDVYSNEEWERISRFNRKTSERVHDGQLPQLQNGKPYIIIPHSEFTPEMIAFLKNIGVKATLFRNPDDLVVIDEDILSVGSSVA